MPNTIPAAGEAMPTVSLESLVQQYNAADKLVNNLPHALQDSPEEAVFHAAIDAFDDVAVTLSSHKGMMEALRLAAKETDEFTTSNIARVAVNAVLEFLEERDAEMPVERVERLAREMAETLPKWANGSFMAMVYPEGDARGYWFRSVTRDEHGKEADPLVKVINDHKTAWDTYCAVDFGADEEGELKTAWKKPYAVLEKWEKPCTSRDSAIAAMKLAMDEIDAGDGPLAKPMLLAALGYLEGAAA